MADEDLGSADTKLHGTTTLESGRTTIESGSPVTGFTPRVSEPEIIEDPDADFVLYPSEQRYETRRQLGEGGMGEVQLCRDRVIGRDVAMKLMRSSALRRDDLRQRFVREARVQGQLEHPAIVPVYDVGRDEEGRAFFTMRRVRGVTLEDIVDRLRRGDLAAERVHTRHKLLAAFVRVCLAVEFGHEHGVIHRDLKPANVMLGRHGEVYVLDWGLAKVRSASKSLDPRVVTPESSFDAGPTSERNALSGVDGGETAHGVVLGTPQYMAPEQIKGEDIDARADIYALGAILFEILTLEPLQGWGAAAAIFARAVRGVEARPSIRAPHRDVAPELEQACVRATSLQRTERYPRARDLADAVESYLSGDRDIELRQQLADLHLARARDASQRADASISDRATALQEVGRALALAPNNRDALAMLVGFLTAPPRTRVPEVEKRVDFASHASQRSMLPRAAIAYGATSLVFVPLEIALGVRDLHIALIPLALWLLAAALALFEWRYAPRDRSTFPSVTITAALALAMSSLLHGPVVVVPAIGAVMVMAMTLQTPRSNRRFLIGINALAIGIPTVLAWLGLHPVRHAFPGGDLLVSGSALVFSEEALALVGVMHVTFIIVGGLFIGAYCDHLRTLQTRAHLQAWQLEQLVPPEAVRVIEPAVPSRR